MAMSVPDLAAIQELVDRIVREFHPERVVLFGSRAYGEPRPDSDVDLLVVLPFEGTPYGKAVEILQAVRPTFSVDVLPRRPDDTERRYRLGDPLVREALDRGKVLFEAR
jgi:predicted nucleotidyltransferase